MTFGTADYISPEQARGQTATPRSDIYSLGVTLYETLTNRLPFSGDSSIAVAMQHVSTDPPPPRMYNPRIRRSSNRWYCARLAKRPMASPTTARFCAPAGGYYRIGDQATVVGPRRRADSAAQPAPMPRNAPSQHQPQHRRARCCRQRSQRRPTIAAWALVAFCWVCCCWAACLGWSTWRSAARSTICSTSPPRAAVPRVVAGQPTESPTGVPQFQVPSLANLTSQQAFDAIQAANLTPREEAPRYSDVYSTGLVLDQFPLAGTTVTQTTVVTFAVSLGPNLIDQQM